MKCLSRTRFITFIALVSLMPAMPCSSMFATTPFQDEAKEDRDLTPEEIEAHNEQVGAYAEAIDEKDPVKQADLLVAFMDKYPKSDMIETYIKPAYRALLFECYTNKKFKELDAITGKWLKLFPDNMETVSLAAAAAKELKNDKKYLDLLLKIYEVNPTVGGAFEITKLYKSMGNFDKFIEWAEKTLKYPDYDVDYTLRYEIMSMYVDRQNYPKASEWAKKILPIIDAAPKPDAAGAKQMKDIRRTCYSVIAYNYYETGKNKESIEYFEKALRVEKFQDGFYYIGQIYWRTQNPEKAHDYFAAAEIFDNGSMTEKAKEHKEQLYKSLHNNTLIGIDKVMKRAESIIRSYSAPATPAE
jgi:tetratricopeptide (TPR) repeat protein